LSMRNILVIDDDACVRAVVASTFTRLGYQVQTAENGAVGLRIFEAEPADLVITDILMPEKDGIEVIIALRQYLYIPKVIAMSGGGQRCGMEVLRTAKLLGADAVMSKPLSMSQLVRVAGELLDAQAEDFARRIRRGVRPCRRAA